VRRASNGTQDDGTTPNMHNTRLMIFSLAAVHMVALVLQSCIRTNETITCSAQNVQQLYRSNEA
jgi:hypothetical protein